MANAAAKTLKKVSLELGGKNPQIVFPDADLDGFVDAAVFGAYFNAGECCNAGSPPDRPSRYRRRVRRRASTSSPPRSRSAIRSIPATRSARSSRPSIWRRSRAMSSAAAGDGATVVHGGDAARPRRRPVSWRRPSCPRCHPDMAIAREEVFGPVLSVLTFETTGRGDRTSPMPSTYGLSAGVWSRDFDTCLTVGARRARRNGLDEHLHGRRIRTAVRRLQAVRPRPRARAATRWRTTPKTKTLQYASSAGAPVVDAGRITDEPRLSRNRSASPRLGSADRSENGFRFANLLMGGFRAQASDGNCNRAGVWPARHAPPRTSRCCTGGPPAARRRRSTC